MYKVIIKEILDQGQLNQNYIVQGWVRNKRVSKSISFITITDGTCFRELQVVINNSSDFDSVLKDLNTGASVSVHGRLVQS